MINQEKLNDQEISSKAPENGDFQTAKNRGSE